jgi:hypothetical protein
MGLRFGHGVMPPPALVVNGEPKLAGCVPPAKPLKEFLS